MMLMMMMMMMMMKTTCGMRITLSGASEVYQTGWICVDVSDSFDS